MRVAFWLGQFPKLSETFILSQITGLIDRGVDVRIIADSTPLQRKVHPQVEQYKLLHRATYRPKIPRNKLWRLIRGMALVLCHGPRHPAKVCRCLNPFKYGKSATSLLMLYYAMPFLRDGDFDVIHAHFGPGGELAASLLDAGILRGPLVTSFYGYDVTRHPRMKGSRAYMRLFEQAARILVLSEQMKRQVRALGASDEQLLVHHLGVDLSRFAFRERRPPQGCAVRLLTIARLVEKKGAEYALRAISKVRRQGLAVEYSIIGDGPLRSELETLAQSLKLSDCVRFLGGQDQSEVVQRLDQADIFLLSSVRAADGDEEGTPTAILEAMACGLPILSTLHSGIPELVEDGKSGWLVPERDIDALAERIGWMIDHSDQWAAMGRAGRAKVEKEFNIDTLSDQLVEMYQEMLAQGEQGRV